METEKIKNAGHESYGSAIAILPETGRLASSIRETEEHLAYGAIAKSAKKKVKKKSKSKPLTKKAKPKTIPKQPVKKKLSTVSNSCRMDIRLPSAEREKLMRKAKATRRTMTSIMVELIEKMK